MLPTPAALLTNEMLNRCGFVHQYRKVMSADMLKLYSDNVQAYRVALIALGEPDPFADSLGDAPYSF